MYVNIYTFAYNHIYMIHIWICTLVITGVLIRGRPQQPRRLPKAPPRLPIEWGTSNFHRKCVPSYCYPLIFMMPSHEPFKGDAWCRATDAWCRATDAWCRATRKQICGRRFISAFQPSKVANSALLQHGNTAKWYGAWFFRQSFGAGSRP